VQRKHASVAHLKLQFQEIINRTSTPNQFNILNMNLSSQMKQWVTMQDGAQNLTQETVMMPQAGKGEVLVKISTVSLNYRDTEGTHMTSRSIFI
jgi:hypothetical protein